MSQQTTAYHRVQAAPAGRISSTITARAYEVYSHLYGTRQSLERLNERGGFCWAEMTAFLYAWPFPQSEWRQRVDEAGES